MPAPFSYAPRLAGVPVLWNIMKIDIVSVFPEYFEVLNLSLLGKAQEKGLVEVTAHNLRDWTHDVHHSVDDTPVGGGAGGTGRATAGAIASITRKFRRNGSGGSDIRGAEGHRDRP